ncbi:MAG: glycosyltransferase family 2 protein [Alphaproteobacteria bacterium]
MLCPRERFLTMGGFDESFPRPGAEDRDFCDRWRASGWPIAWCARARVEHRHPQTLAKFVELHFRYGRGARVYQLKRRDRAADGIDDDPGFHSALPGRVRPRLAALGSPPRRAAALASLGVWQAANAAGFAVEALGGSSRKGAS